MKRNQKMVTGVFLLVIVIALGFFDAHSWSALDQPKPLMAEEETIMVSNEEKPEEQTIEFEQVLVHKEEVDGYLVETYQEHEIVRDKDGELIDLVPTDHYDYIRYKLNE
ncbi:hypothetical protein [Bacillus sp. CGMCC 1.16541]|uniref:hypothetical protein n=1 Tax=Bacillus sp. CGMCC 1.16541 TaxID=2185143 RepID=UPI000D72E136|nr:hypothetical protein [Bacillus sp. CGMCC 1.16541]